MATFTWPTWSRHAGRIVAFDCIEFNPEMRWIDVMSDLAFTLMDLRHRGRAEFARVLLESYLTDCGDWDGVALLPFYQCYRAMVRAKVAAFRAGGTGDDVQAHGRATRDCLDHLLLAESFTQPGRARLLITCGASGSGKSHISGRLVMAGEWLRLRSDVERKRIAGLAPLAASASALHAGLYAEALTTQVYARLAGLAEGLLRGGFAVIVDATFLRREQREQFRRLATQLHVPFTILSITARRAELERRIIARAARGDDASEANLRVLDAQLRDADPIEGDEASATVQVDSHAPCDVAALAARIETQQAAAPAPAC